MADHRPAEGQLCRGQRLVNPGLALAASVGRYAPWLGLQLLPRSVAAIVLGPDHYWLNAADWRTPDLPLVQSVC
jgi:hypothetical protein